MANHLNYISIRHGFWLSAMAYVQRRRYCLFDFNTGLLKATLRKIQNEKRQNFQNDRHPHKKQKHDRMVRNSSFCVCILNLCTIYCCTQLKWTKHNNSNIHRIWRIKTNFNCDPKCNERASHRRVVFVCVWANQEKKQFNFFHFDEIPSRIWTLNTDSH